MKDLVAEMRRFKRSQDPARAVFTINRIEQEADTMFVDALRTLHTAETDPLRVFAWHEVYTQLEECADACEKVADVIDNCCDEEQLSLPLALEPGDGQLRAVGHAELVQDSADAVAHGALRQAQSGGDVTVGRVPCATSAAMSRSRSLRFGNGIARQRRRRGGGAVPPSVCRAPRRRVRPAPPSRPARRGRRRTRPA